MYIAKSRMSMKSSSSRIPTGGYYQSQNATESYINGLVGSGLTVGISPRSLSLTNTDGACIKANINGGGGPGVLPVGPWTCATVDWGNSLVRQTVILGLNLRASPALGNFGLVANRPDGSMRYCTTNGTYTIPASVISALAASPFTKDVNGLFALANNGLGNATTYGASLGDINNAMGAAINPSFEGGCACIIVCPLTLYGDLEEDVVPQVAPISRQ